MLFEISSRATDVKHAIFRPADYLLGIVQQVVVSQVNTRIALLGNGELVVLPEFGEYYTNVQDMPEFCRAPAAQFELSVIGDSDRTHASGARGHIKDLLWQAAFHASQGCLVEGSSKYDVVQFCHWPNLTRLSVTPNAARICALLTRHPTTIMLVHRVLGIEKEEVFQIYAAARSAGISKTISLNPESENLAADTTDAPPELVKEHGLFRSLFAKLSGL